MSETICVDASLIVAMVWYEQFTEQVNMLWRTWAAEKKRLVAPTVLRFEVAGVLERKMRSGALESNMARISIAMAESLATRIEQPEIIGGLETAWDLAGSYRLRVLDACYLAIARQENAELWTLDRELARRARGRTP